MSNTKGKKNIINHETIRKMGRYKGMSIAGIDPKTLKDLYGFMLRLRRCQEAIVKEYHTKNEMRCPVHFSIGQEAMPAALSQVISKDDILFGPHRSHGYYLSKGAPMNALIAELYGKETGADGGKSGSQEVSYPSVNFFSGAILSGMLAIAVGTGLGFQLKKNTNVAVVALGDGAVDEGIFWEAVNYAQLCKLPVIFICENNRFSTYSPQTNRQTADNIHDKVAAFGLRTYAIFGNDVIKAMKTLKEAIAYARKGKGPVFVEAYTYRWMGHVGPEDDDYVGYRPVSEIEFWKRNCPIALLEEKILSKKIISKEEKKRMIDDIDREIAEAFKYAKESSFPNDMNWENQNYDPSSPLADKLLEDAEEPLKFKHNQAETKPEPY